MWVRIRLSKIAAARIPRNAKNFGPGDPRLAASWERIPAVALRKQVGRAKGPADLLRDEMPA
jgi:hypothetical protein